MQPLLAETHLYLCGLVNADPSTCWFSCTEASQAWSVHANTSVLDPRGLAQDGDIYITQSPWKLIWLLP